MLTETSKWDMFILLVCLYYRFFWLFFFHKINGVKSLFDDTWLDKFQIENIQTQWYHKLTPSTDVHFVKNEKIYIYTQTHILQYTQYVTII